MAKNKMKTQKSAAKRFRVTKNGKIIRRRAYAWHKTGKKRRSTLRKLKLEAEVAACEKNRVLRMLGKK
ncbi:MULTISPECIES: 50S ribosomal protein L35 [Thermosipho]|uniref:Large ribosomal subunit protein bL35 n=1 Tax=Thermosipho affectus TaxID=660294 RepID=A0ABX3IJ47_9BACT|nr:MULTISPECIES: 50S ribosomal protein L35 [Thermosipho]ANQ53869.1 50S ribosomal protein L35 [Thermosipho sp. 1070]APT72316.1 50S ribosomal protein L35 [Thermosipho sp. 1063]MBT1248007.1 50S ribosomal protein L35 [Thermosipho sp. 1244]ONN27221.1 50S ribosomal protein L35 [Thermosipho affectus]OOC43560.1 50S ribosomal protein L35 [Thermosipho sp. 1074]